MHSLKQALIFAAGLGTRLRPLTDRIPKALVEINGKPMLERLIEKLIAAGIQNIVINIHHFSKLIIDFVVQKKQEWLYTSYFFNKEIALARFSLLPTSK
jgi:NDP-sugar pyrophosphorylase family protein